MTPGEVRSPKSEIRNPNAEIRRLKLFLSKQIFNFALGVSFGLRISDFGFLSSFLARQFPESFRRRVNADLAKSLGAAGELQSSLAEIAVLGHRGKGQFVIPIGQCESATEGAVRPQPN